MSVQTNPFRRTTIVIMFAFGFAAFVALLYGLGMGDSLASGKNGDAHGASNSIVGYKAFANLLEKTGVAVQYSRSPTGMENEGLLILTPGPYTPGEEIDAVVQQRAYVGPTMIILPKWQVFSNPELEKGWVIRGEPLGAESGAQILKDLAEVTLDVDDKTKAGRLLGRLIVVIVVVENFPGKTPGFIMGQITFVRNDNFGVQLTAVTLFESA